MQRTLKPEAEPTAGARLLGDPRPSPDPGPADDAHSGPVLQDRKAAC